VAGNGFSVTGLRVFPQRVFLALSPQNAAMAAKVPKESFAFHRPSGAPVLAIVRTSEDGVAANKAH
jgi:hypothetical protein